MPIDKIIEPHREPRGKTISRDYHKDLEKKLEKAFSADAQTLRKQLPRLGREFLRAAERGNPRTLGIFLDKGMDINYQDSDSGQTALHAAAAAQARYAVRLLIAQDSCDFLLRDKQGRLPSELAYLYGRDPALARLLGNKERKQARAQGTKLTRRP